MTTPIPVIIDTDVGDDVDDALAIAFALLRPELAVKAITTVYGPVARRRAIVARLLEVVAGQKGGEPSSLPLIAAGEALPLTPLPQQSKEKLLAAVPNQYPFAEEGPAAPAPEADWVEVCERVIQAHSGEVVLVTIGALTNAARLLQSRPDLARKLRSISIMGGSFLPGRVEYNIHCDPLAAAQVFASDIPKAVFSWEVSGRVVLEPQAMAELRRGAGVIPRALCRLIELWWPHKGKRVGPAIYDMSPLLWLFRPELYLTEERGVEVVTAPGPECGRTLAGRGPLAAVATDMDVAAATRLFLDTVCR